MERMNWAVFGLKFALAAALVYWLVWSRRLDLAGVADIQNAGALAAAIVCRLAGMLLPLLRWQLLLRGAGFSLRVARAMQIGLIGTFFSTLTPSMLGQDAARLYYRHSVAGASVADIARSLVADRGIGLAALAVLTMLSLAWLPGGVPDEHRTWLPATAATMVAVVLLAILAAARGRLGQAMERYLSTLPNAGRAVLLSLMGHLCMMASVYFGLHALGASPDVMPVLAASAVLIFVRILPIAPLGLGVTDWAGEELFARIGIGQGAEVVMLTRLIGLLPALAGGLFLLVPVHSEEGLQTGERGTANAIE